MTVFNWNLIRNVLDTERELQVWGVESWSECFNSVFRLSLHVLLY